MSAARPRRHTVLVVVLCTQLIVGVLTVGGVWLAYANLNDSLADGSIIKHIANPKPEVEGPKEPMNILLMGSDSRSGAGNDIDGLGDIGQRSDTTILLHVSADRQSAYGISLPRDAIVDRPDCEVDGEVIPGETTSMFNEAFSVGGPLCTVQMVEKLTDVYIDHFLVLDFRGFKDMVDAVDGVQVCIPRDVTDYEHDIFFTAGTQTLSGQQALNYVRERYQLSVTGDIGRMKRQQSFIASMVNKVMSAGTLAQPQRVYDFLRAVTSSIQVDENLDTIGKLADLAAQFRDTGLSRIKFITVPIAPYPEDPNRLIWTEDAERVWDRVRSDRPLGPMLSEGSIRADESVGSSSPTDGATPSDDATDSPSDTEEEAEQRLAAGLCA